MLDLISSTLTQGFIYALLSYGVYITYSVLDFPAVRLDRQSTSREIRVSTAWVTSL